MSSGLMSHLLPTSSGINIENGPAGRKDLQETASNTYILQMAQDQRVLAKDPRLAGKFYISTSSAAGSPGSRHRTRSVDTRRASIEAAVGSPRSKSAAAPRRHTIVTGPSRPSDGYNSDSSSGEETEHEQSAAPAEEMDAQERLAAARAKLTSPSVTSNLTSLSRLTTQTNSSGSSSGSGSTLTQASFNRQQERAARLQEGQKRSDRPRESSLQRPNKPDALSFLDPDSPEVTREAIERSVAQAEARSQPSSQASTIIDVAKTSPSARSTDSYSSSGSTSSARTNASSAWSVSRETDRSSSPDRSVDGDDSTPVQTLPPGADKPATAPRRIPGPRPTRSTSGQSNAPREMIWGPRPLDHLPQSGLTPRAMIQDHAKRAQRVEKFSLTGYELLATHLSSGSSPSSLASPVLRYNHPARRGSVVDDSGSGVGSGDFNARDRRQKIFQQHEGPRIAPIYRRFEALNHRLLLHMQDELCELEEQLHRLDAADTQARRLPDGSLMPASRRAEAAAGGELQWHKTDVLGKIGFKLGQYNTVLSSFTESQKLSTASRADVDKYRSYLSREGPIAEMETHFLEHAGDLVSLARRLSAGGGEPPFLSSSSPLSSSSFPTSSSPPSSFSYSSSPSSLPRTAGDDHYYSSSPLSFSRYDGATGDRFSSSSFQDDAEMTPMPRPRPPRFPSVGSLREASNVYPGGSTAGDSGTPLRSSRLATTAQARSNVDDDDDSRIGRVDLLRETVLLLATVIIVPILMYAVFTRLFGSAAMAAILTLLASTGAVVVVAPNSSPVSGSSWIPAGLFGTS